MITKEQREELLRPFGPDDLEWKVQSCGKKKDGSIWASIVPYVAARAIQTRLDDVFGVGGWQAEFREVAAGGETGFICRLSVWDGDRLISREDGAPATDIEPIKGGISGAFKRAAVLWGIGRYLYSLDAVYADIVKSGGHRASLPRKKYPDAPPFYWRVPKDALAAAIGHRDGERDGGNRVAADGVEDGVAGAILALKRELASTLRDAGVDLDDQAAWVRDHRADDQGAPTLSIADLEDLIGQARAIKKPSQEDEVWP